MSDATIELLQNYKPENMAWPAAHQEKIDGVPVIIGYQNGHWLAFTRQGELINSIDHIVREVAYLFNRHRDVRIVGELFIPDQPFKYISGKVRKNAACPDLTLHIFDAPMLDAGKSAEWINRMTWLEDFLELQALSVAIQHMRIIPWTICQNEDDADRAHAQLMSLKPTAEGSVLHSCMKLWEPGKRSWHTQRIKPTPTIDLKIVGFEEATSEAGKPLGMVGRLIAELSSMTPAGVLATATVGIGPGKLTHPERKALWAAPFQPRIAEIKYMRDDTYDALRQPTFQTWRDDKSTPDTYRRAA